MNINKTESLGTGSSFGILPNIGGVDFLLSIGVIPVDYFLEKKVGGKTISVLPLPNQPKNVSITKEYAETPIYTFDSTHAHLETGRARSARVSIMGESGQRNRLGVREDGSLFNASGLDHLKAFDRFLSMYFSEAANIQAPSVKDLEEVRRDLKHESKPHLVFRALQEGIHGRATIESFSYKRDAGTHRLGYVWELNLRIYDPSEPALTNVIDDFYDTINGFSNDIAGTFLLVDQTINALSDTVFLGGRAFRNMGQIAEAFREAVTSPISAVENAFSMARNFGEMIESFVVHIPGAVSEFKDYFSASNPNSGLARANRLKYGFDYFVDSTTPPDANEPVINFSLSTLESSLTEQQDSVHALVDLFYLYEVLSGYLGLVRERGNEDFSTFGFLATEIGYATLASLLTPLTNAPEENRNLDTHSEYILRAGESLLTIAHRFMGSSTLWLRLAEINEAQDAYTNKEGVPYRAGDIIKIPVAVQGLAPLLNPQGNFSTRDAIATDISISLSGDLILNQGDIQIVSGVHNLRQTVINRLRTISGDLTMDQTYGLNSSLIGVKLTEQVTAYMITQIRENLLQDVRILDVRDITIQRIKSSVHVSMSVYCINDVVINLQTDL